MDVQYDLSTFTITKLKLLCHYSNISPIGTKNELLSRLNTIHYTYIEEGINKIELENQLESMLI